MSFADACDDCLAGVIAVGAGFSFNRQPPAKQTFAIFAAAGFDDFNFIEMRDLERRFNSLPAPFRFESYAGTHDWLNETAADDALGWFNLLAMRDKTLAIDENFVETQYVQRQTDADKLLAAKRFLDAYQNYVSIVKDFQNWRNVTELTNKIEKLKTSSELKKEMQSETELGERQRTLTGEIINGWTTKISAEGEISNSQNLAAGKIKELQKKKAADKDSPERRLARRTLDGLFIGALETGSSQVKQKNYSSAVAQFELAHAVEPENINITYELARIYALNKQKKEAMQTLEAAAALGFKDYQRIEADEAFKSLSQESRFQKLLTKLK